MTRVDEETTNLATMTDEEQLVYVEDMEEEIAELLERMVDENTKANDEIREIDQQYEILREQCSQSAERHNVLVQELEGIRAKSLHRTDQKKQAVQDIMQEHLELLTKYLTDCNKLNRLHMEQEKDKSGKAKDNESKDN